MGYDADDDDDKDNYEFHDDDNNDNDARTESRVVPKIFALFTKGGSEVPTWFGLRPMALSWFWNGQESLWPLFWHALEEGTDSHDCSDSHTEQT